MPSLALHEKSDREFIPSGCGGKQYQRVKDRNVNPGVMDP